MNDALDMYARFATEAGDYTDGMRIRELAQEAVIQVT